MCFPAPRYESSRKQRIGRASQSGHQLNETVRNRAACAYLSPVGIHGEITAGENFFDLEGGVAQALTRAIGVVGGAQLRPPRGIIGGGQRCVNVQVDGYAPFFEVVTVSHLLSALVIGKKTGSLVQSSVDNLGRVKSRRNVSGGRMRGLKRQGRGAGYSSKQSGKRNETFRRLRIRQRSHFLRSFFMPRLLS